MALSEVECKLEFGGPVDVDTTRTIEVGGREHAKRYVRIFNTSDMHS